MQHKFNTHTHNNTEPQHLHVVNVNTPTNSTSLALPNNMGQSPSWDVNSQLTVQETPHYLWNLKVPEL
jgi:hypothetical protein